MSSVEKARKGKKKKAKKETQETEVLERVMSSIEMAGASLDFFESEDVVAGKVELDEQVEEAVQALPDAEAAEMFAEELERELSSGDTLEDSVEEVEMAALADGEEASDEETLQALSEGAGEEEAFEALSEEDSAEFSDDDEDGENLDMLEDDSEKEFIEQKQAYSILESLLFSSDRPIGMGTFKQVFKGTTFKSKDIKAALEALQVEYADPARGVTLEEINGGWQLRTKVDNMDFLRKLAKARPFKLSGPALEVLAIIAYKQPIVKSEVDEIRGVESGHLVRALMEKHLVNFQGKSELPGKPMQYGTTRKFLEIFGLRNLRELPSLDEIDQLLPDGIGIEEEDEKLSDVTESMAEEFSGSYSEGEEELEKIEATLGDIDTSSEFFEQEKQKQKEKRDRDRARDIREALDVGEAVDPKDEKWLERYEAKLAEEAAAAEAAAASAEGEAFKEDLSDLSAESESLVSDEILAADAELEAADSEAEDSDFQDAETFDPFADDEDDESSENEF